MDRSGEVEALVLACYESWRTGDIAVFESLLANDETVLMVGTNPEEWWSGPNAVIEALRSLLPQTADLELLPGHPQAFESGDVAWFADRARVGAPKSDRGTFPDDGCSHTGGRWMEDAANAPIDRRRQRGRDRSRASGLAASRQGR